MLYTFKISIALGFLSGSTIAFVIHSVDSSGATKI